MLEISQPQAGSGQVIQFITDTTTEVTIGMTKLKSVNIGHNKFCGPAVLSILTGKSTDECAYVIGRINGQYNVTGVTDSDLLKAADRLGFDTKPVAVSGSLYRTLTSLVNHDGMYIVMVPRHFVCIEVSDKKIYFCDNHTKEPIPAASSARLGMSVIAAHKVTEREKLPEPPKPEVTGEQLTVFTYGRVNGVIDILINRVTTYNIGEPKKEHLASFSLKNMKELEDMLVTLSMKSSMLQVTEERHEK